jgi:release factor glutamine methyltransferase
MIMVYEPAEDTYLILEEVKKYAKGKVLEIGTGSGIISTVASEKKDVKAVIAVDIDKKAIAHCKKTIKNKKIIWKVSDLFSEVKGKFDTIIINPPYLPFDRREDEETRLTTTGGRHGYELTERFLNSANDHLEKDGIIILLFSTLTNKEKIDEALANNLFECEIIATKKVSFETLFVYLIKKNKFSKILDDKRITCIRRLTKGHRGLIFVGRQKKGTKYQEVTIKIQRWDIGAKGTVNNETTVLEKINKKGIGPQLYDSGDNFFIYKYIPGEFILEYLSHANKKEATEIILDVFKQMRILDLMGLNKEEMHHPVKHVIITPQKKAVLVDFERCKPTHKPQNVTQFCQFVTGGRVAGSISKKGIIIDKKEMMIRAGKYKKDMSDTNYESILDLL